MTPQLLSTFNYTAVITSEKAGVITKNYQVIAKVATAALQADVANYLKTQYPDASSIVVSFDGDGIVANALYFG